LVEFSGSHEVLKVPVVCPYLHFVLSAFREVSPFLKCSDDHEHLLVMDFIVPFHSAEGLGHECDRMPLVIFRRMLGKDCSGSIIGAVCLDPEGVMVSGED